MVAILAALGAGPASLLPGAWGLRARAAMAPVLGLCVAACGLTTLEWFVPGRSAAPALAGACAVSLAAALWRGRPAKGMAAALAGVSPRAAAAGAAQVLAVMAVCFVPMAATLAAHHSVGPMSYQVFDGPGYVANAQAASTVSIHAAAGAHRPTGYVAKWWSLDAASPNRLDYAPVVAAVDVLLGLNATQTYAADLLALLAIGGLGCYAAVLVASERRNAVFAMLAGAAFGGGFFLQLVFDGSQAALCGLVVLVPLLAVVAAAARAPRAATLAVAALLLAGLATLYPIFLFPAVAAVALAGAFRLAQARRRGRLELGAVVAWAARAGAVLAGAAALDVVATVRDAASLGSIATGGGILASFPAYHLGAGVVASWLLQTRDLYAVAFGAQSALSDAVPALVVPAALLVVALGRLRRSPVAWLCLLVVAVSLLAGAYEALQNGCGYCEDRSMLTAVPPLVLLVFAGLGTAYSSARLLGRAALVAVTVAYVGFAAYDVANARARYGAGSVYVTSAERALVARIPARAGPVELEGFGAGPSSIAVEPYLYELVEAHGVAASAATATEGAGLAEDWGPEPLRPPWFDPGYRLVLTRLSGVSLGRRRLAAAGPVALERRVRPLGVTVESGLHLATRAARVPTVTGPLDLVVSGAGRAPVAVRLGFDRVGPPRSGAGARSRCVEVGGTARVRSRVVAPAWAAGWHLDSIAAAPGRCAPAPPGR